jgi:hypothetical protein
MEVLQIVVALDERSHLSETILDVEALGSYRRE